MKSVPSEKNGKSGSFTAYSGAEDIPEDFASMNVVRSEAGLRAGVSASGAGTRGRTLLFLAALAVSLVLAWQQFGERLSSAVSMAVELPDVRWPERILPEGRWIDRPFQHARIVTPLTRLREDEIRSVLAGHLDHGYFSLDVNRLKTELESHPWVSRAAVRKVWPDGLSVSVREHRPIAQHIAAGGSRRLVSGAGEWSRGHCGPRQPDATAAALHRVVSAGMARRRAWPGYGGSAL